MPTMTDTDTDDDLDQLDDFEPLPPRPRRRLLAPIPLALLGVLIAAAGFVGGVLVQKHSAGSTTSAFPGAAGFAAARSGGATGATGGGADTASQGTSGEVSSKKGDVLYVTTSDGTTVKVKLAGATVTRTAETGKNAIHPGDTVVVQGATQDNGTVKATAVTASAPQTSSPSQSGDPVGQLFGG